MPINFFIPLYDKREMENMLRYYADGSLDGIHPTGCVTVGVKNVERAAHQSFRALSLAQRYTARDIESVLAEMARNSEPLPTYALLIVLAHLFAYPVHDIARALHHSDCSYSLTVLCEAQDEFMRRLLNG